ncbi:hypothetical protein Micbo1qcDRAFT_602 [Microdochium bolleyi]|uniref:Uncharacterized protein n=1 Tax=Microdochium bolleyi TaxID=196109 RepID=A0A136JGV6_9PEZI|nr:hypothetical protein Micbo1qcDRAFT_602 [Microdochium bolleyi]
MSSKGHLELPHCDPPAVLCRTCLTPEGWKVRKMYRQQKGGGGSVSASCKKHRRGYPRHYPHTRTAQRDGIGNGSDRALVVSSGTVGKLVFVFGLPVRGRTAVLRAGACHWPSLSPTDIGGGNKISICPIQRMIVCLDGEFWYQWGFMLRWLA